MVPGIAERERRIADAQRRDWLAEVVVGPAGTTRSLTHGPGPSHARGNVAISRQRRFFPVLRDLRLATDILLRKSTVLISERAPAE